MSRSSLTPEIFKMLGKLARKSGRILAPYVKLQRNFLAAAKTQSLHGLTSRTLNMRKLPSISNIPQVVPPRAPVEIPEDLVSHQEQASAPAVSLPLSDPLSYAANLRIPRASLVKQISRQPFWQAQVEAARQAQLQRQILSDMLGLVGQPRAPAATGVEKPESPVRRRKPSLPSPRYTAGVVSHPLVPQLMGQHEALLAPPLPQLPPPLLTAATIGTQTRDSPTVLPSKLAQIGRQLPSVPSLPLISKLYSQAVKLSKTVEKIPILRRTILSSQAQSQRKVQSPMLPSTPIGDLPVQNLAPPSHFRSISPKIIALDSATELAFPAHAIPNPAKNPIVEVPQETARSNEQPVKIPPDRLQRPLVHNPTIQLTRAVTLNLAKMGSLKHTIGLSIPPQTLGPAKSTPAQAREQFSQNQVRLVTTLAEMETAQTKMQLTNRNPIPQLPRVELPRIQSSTARQNGGTFTVQQNQEVSKPVELGINEQAPTLRETGAIADWATPEPETLSSTNELRLKIAKILEEEARRYLPEE